MNEQYPVMPDLSHGYCGFHHTLDSALSILSDLNIPLGRITVRTTGRGYPSQWVLEQDPAPGKPLDPGTRVTLSIAGLGFFSALPVGMWDKGDEAEPGTKELVELFDDPLQKAAHWVREGARLFDIRPDDAAACARWISLFGVTPEAWPTELWYNLGLLLPSLQSLSGTERGIRFALDLLLGLPVKEIRRSPAFRPIREPDFTLLEKQYSRLSIDAVLGDRQEDLAKITLVVGPVPLDTYYDFQEDEKRKLLDAVLGLVTSCYQRHAIRWEVGDTVRAPKLSYARQNAILGLNSHLGKRPWNDPKPQETAVS